jgi:hypothetical protein
MAAYSAFDVICWYLLRYFTLFWILDICLDNSFHHLCHPLGTIEEMGRFKLVPGTGRCPAFFLKKIFFERLCD